MINEIKTRAKNEKEHVKTNKSVPRETKHEAPKTTRVKKGNTGRGGQSTVGTPGGRDGTRACPAETKEQAKAARGDMDRYISSDSPPAAKEGIFPLSDVTDLRTYNSIDEVLADEELADEEFKEETKLTSLAKQIKKYIPGYVVSVTHNGTKSRACGDEVSLILEGKSLAEVFHICHKYLDVDLTTKWLHLNPGQRRMCAGNTLRAAVKRGDVSLK